MYPPAPTWIWTVTFDDTRYNNSNGSEPTQDVVAAEYYIDVAPWEPGAGAFAVSLLPADSSFDSGVEGVQARSIPRCWPRAGIPSTRARRTRSATGA